MTVTQRFSIGHPDGDLNAPVWELTREQAEELYNDLREALGFSGWGSAIIPGPDLATTSSPTPPPPMTPEEEAAQAQVLAKLAHQAAVSTDRRDGTAIGSQNHL